MTTARNLLGGRFRTLRQRGVDQPRVRRIIWGAVADLTRYHRAVSRRARARAAGHGNAVPPSNVRTITAGRFPFCLPVRRNAALRRIAKVYQVGCGATGHAGRGIDDG